MDRQKYESIRAILARISDLEHELAELLSNEPLSELAPRLRSSIEEIALNLEREVEQQFHQALARVNFRDQHYTFIRAIDGDTVELEPPQELREWMRDVHVRLYGIDTPEKNEEFGSLYTNLLTDLCTKLVDKKVFVIWERERYGTEYALYPRTSFERGIGNLFIPYKDKLLYVNSIFAMLPHVHVERNDQSLIRGHKRLEILHNIGLWSGGCRTGLPDEITKHLGNHINLPQFFHGRFPICLAIFPKQILSAAEQSPSEALGVIQNSIAEHGCPFSNVKIELGNNSYSLFDDRTISPFDVPLILSAHWARQFKVTNTNR